MENQFAPEGRPTKFCSNCGAKIDKEAEICPKCGVRQTVSQPLRTGFAPAVVPPPTDVDLTAAASLKNGSLVAVIGEALSFFSFTLLIGFILNPYSLISTFALSGLVGYMVVLLVGLILGIVSLVMYRHAFVDLTRVDLNSFKTPASFLKLYYIGLILLLVGAIVLILGMLAAISALSIGLLFGFLILSVIVWIVAAILMILGLIGLVLGLWRAGERYNNTLIKIGGILYIIPYASVVAPILVLIGANSVEKQMNSGGFQAVQQSGSFSQGMSGQPRTLPQKEDVAQKLNTLKTMYESGQLSSEEYEKKRKELLDSL